MHNTDITTFQKKISKFIDLTGVLYGNYIPRIIRSCQLKPEAVFNSKLNFRKTFLVNRWLDNFGNTLTLDNGSARVEHNVHNNLVSSDLFYGRSLRKTIAQSKLLYIDDDTVICYGKDNYIRAFSKTQRIAPLIKGLAVLKFFFENENVGSFKTLNDATIIALPLKKEIKYDVQNWIKMELNG